MNDRADSQRISDRTPAWVWAVMLALSLTQPLTAHWIQHFPPVGTVPTGLSGGDSAVFIHCIRMFDTGFFSPYANCHSALGTHSPANFPAPFFWLYGVIGALGRALRLDDFQTLGWANGVCGFLYLFAAYRFLRAAFPRIANLAFGLFALGGGPAGILYVITGFLGLHDHPLFEPYFQRFVEYQLSEGVSLSPILLLPRIYYTLPLACCFGAITCYLIACGTGRQGHRFALGTAAACVLLFAGTFINQRFGPMAWAVILLYAILDRDSPLASRVVTPAVALVSVCAAIALGWAMMRGNLAYVQGTLAVGRNQIWLSPLIVAALFHWGVVPREIVIHAKRLASFARVAAYGALGYLMAFLLLYVGYNAYFGNLWRCLDFTSAVHMSDWALMGVVAGFAWGIARSRRKEEARRKKKDVLCGDVDSLFLHPSPFILHPSSFQPEDRRAQWMVLWFLAFLAVGISAFGQGWFLRLGPQRALAFLGVPVAVLTALGIRRLRETHPCAARALTATILLCGISSILVASACFQGPLGHRPNRGPFAYTHAELITETDAEALEHIDRGVVLAPVTYGPPFGDVIAQRPGLSTVFGYGTLCLSDRDSLAVMRQVQRFFSQDVSEQDRRTLVQDWCVNYVYCPDSTRVEDEVLADLRQIPWLKEVVQYGHAVVFKVGREGERTREPTEPIS